VVADLSSEVPLISEIFQECEKFVSCLSQNVHNLNSDETLAVALYAWDVQPNYEREDNFYYLLNKALQERSVDTIKFWKGYIFFFQRALIKIPSCPKQTVLYRGVDIQDPLKQNYLLGRKVHWSAYSSSSTDINQAKKYATNKGVILQIITSENGAKSISDYSPFKHEKEFLLSPNLEMVVTRELYEEGGYHFIDLVQCSTEQTFVF